MKKFLLWSSALIVVALAGVVVARNIIARKSVELGVGKMTGFPLTIGAVDLGLFDGQLSLNGLKLMNPDGFEEQLFVDLPQCHVDYQFRSLFNGHPHLNAVTIDLNEIIIVKNAKGESNVQRLTGLAGDNSQSTTEPKKHPFQIDIVHVHIGTVVTKDYSLGKLNERDQPLNLNVTYKNINDSTDISRLVLMTVMSQVRLPDIGIHVTDLQKGLGGVQNVTTGVVTSATKGLIGKVKQILPSN